MLQRTRRFFTKLHRDETGPNTVEWILLIIVALIVLLAIGLMARWVIDKFNAKQDAVDSDPFLK